MMTGDHPSTAKAIAKSVGILSLDQDPVERTALLRPAHSCLITGKWSYINCVDEIFSFFYDYTYY